MNGIDPAINQGLQIGWNKSGDSGETNFVNWAQDGTVGGFTFSSISLTYPTTQLASIQKGNSISSALTTTGVLNMNGPINATSFYANGVSLSSIYILI